MFRTNICLAVMEGSTEWKTKQNMTQHYIHTPLRGSVSCVAAITTPVTVREAPDKSRYLMNFLIYSCIDHKNTNIQT